MRFSAEALKKRPAPMVAIAIAAVAVAALGACEHSPDVPAKLLRETGVRVDGERVKLAIGTRVVAECRENDSALAVRIRSGPNEGEDTTIPRSALEATEDPYDALRETPRKTPSAPCRHAKSAGTHSQTWLE